MQALLPYFWTDTEAEQAAAFYVDALPNTSVTTSVSYPEAGLPEVLKSFAGLPLLYELSIDGYTFGLINAGDAYKPNPSLSLILNFDPAAMDDPEGLLRSTHTNLMDGGRELMPLGEYPFSPLYSWVEDRFGVNWQLMLSNPDGDPRPFVVPCFLFGKESQNKAKAAIEFYTDLFKAATVGNLVPYGEAFGPVEANSVMFADFTLQEQWFVAMDSGAETEFTFTPGAYLMVKCVTQGDIDYLWDSLSSTPSAEQCGWCIDEFGMTWQLLPSDITDVLTRPAAYVKLLKMKKVIVDDLH